jgi:hypothetical protein
MKTQLTRKDIDIIFKIWHGKFDHRDETMVEQSLETYKVLTRISEEEIIEGLKNESN